MALWTVLVRRDRLRTCIHPWPKLIKVEQPIARDRPSNPTVDKLRDNPGMTNIAQILKSEISRVARKEIRHEIEGLRKASVQQRSAIAALRREVAALHKQLRQARRTNNGSTDKDATEASTSFSVSRRFSPARLASHRSKLALSAAAYGRLVGVSGQSIYHWEQGKARPQAAQLEALAAVRNLGRKEIAARLTQE